MQTLSPSRIICMLGCARYHFWRYEIGLEPVQAAQPLRFGAAFHRALAARAVGSEYQVALEAGLGEGGDCDEMDAAILAGLLAGYYARYAHDEIATLHPEIEVRLPIKYSRDFEAICIIDGLGTIANGQQILVEHKTTSESIEPDSSYWESLRYATQPIAYVDAARQSGWDIQGVLWDVIRKPSIRQKQNETIAEFGDRLAADTKTRPEFYFARRTLPVLDSDVEEYRGLRDAIARQIVNCRKNEGRYEKKEWAWPRSVGRWTCSGCDCSAFCLQGVSVSKENIPTGMRIK